MMCNNQTDSMPTQDSTGPSQQPPKQPKALRFVTNYGAPHPKRRRVGAACLTCRKRKTACSGERPFCETCKQNKFDCAGYSSDLTTESAHRQTAYCEDPQRHSGESLREEVKRSGESSPGDPLMASHGEKRPQSGSSWRQQTDDLNQCQQSGSSASPPTPPGIAQQVEIAREENTSSLFPRPRDRMPYFRWLGPTAIMPGFKQMVVKIKRQDNDYLARSSTNEDSNGRYRQRNYDASAQGDAAPSMTHQPSMHADAEARLMDTLPFYDNSPMPPSELITHLVNTFFTHLGCNYPFLQRDRFLRDLEEKQVDAILVDAVCALAARFSTHPLLTSQAHQGASSGGQIENDALNESTPAHYGHVFAQRAKQALPHTFACPSVAAVQAALLLAYLEFGESRDSGLWMYLGISIRMAQDLGLNTIEGMKYKGRTGLTPKFIKREGSGNPKKLPTHANDAEISNKEKSSDQKPKTGDHQLGGDTTNLNDTPQSQIEEQKAVEQERMDTFWAVFFLDRVVSSGVGRRSTLRDKDIGLSFPALEEVDSTTGWPAPFPALIRIVHLYGRVADLLNSIKGPAEISPDTSKKLAAMESQVTHFYQGLPSRLHFDAFSFQHYVRAGEGTNFVLLHFWFHMLIILLHQPTLLKTFEGKMLQLFPNSQQLSMSSAKTIADILSYSQLIDAKVSLGNPFTTQPIYIAACAFLKETMEQTASSAAQSRSGSPVRRGQSDSQLTSRIGSAEHPSDTPTGAALPSLEGALEIPVTGPDTVDSGSSKVSSGGSARSRPSGQRKSAHAKHTLLATAATQHYQLCYKALQSLENYWAGTKYILTILDQKFQGVEDPLLYTVEESESSLERPRPIPEFRSPGWRRKLSDEAAFSSLYLSRECVATNEIGPTTFWRTANAGEPDTSKAIGWTLTGNMNSPSTNLAWHYPNIHTEAYQGGQTRLDQLTSDPVVSKYQSPGSHRRDVGQLQTAYQPRTEARPDMGASTPRGGQPPSSTPVTSQQQQGQGMSNVDAADVLLGLNDPYQQFRNPFPNVAQYQTPTQSHEGGTVAFSEQMQTPWMTFPMDQHPFGDMTIESQDVDMSMLGLDMMPWFESYPPHDMIGLLEAGGMVVPGNMSTPGADIRDQPESRGHNNRQHDQRQQDQ